MYDGRERWHEGEKNAKVEVRERKSWDKLVIVVEVDAGCWWMVRRGRWMGYVCSVPATRIYPVMHTTDRSTSFSLQVCNVPVWGNSSRGGKKKGRSCGL